MTTETPPKSARRETFACWLCSGPATIDERYAEVPLFRCSDCGFLFAPQRPVDELHAIYDDSYFEEYPGGESYEFDKAQRRHEAAIRIDWLKANGATGGRLLEIGAANGSFLAEARDRGFEVFGVEPAAGLAAKAREELGLDVRAGFIETVELPSEPFDAICAWHVLEHISEPKASLDRLRRSIAEDGRLFLEIPNIESVMADRQGTGWFNLDPANHVAFYDREQLATLLSQSDFKLIHTESVSGFHYLSAARARRPREIASRCREMLLTRTLPSRPHPWKHELLRAIAVPV